MIDLLEAHKMFERNMIICFKKQMKKTYWIYISVTILLISGLIIGLVLGFRNSNNEDNSGGVIDSIVKNIFRKGNKNIEEASSSPSQINIENTDKSKELNNQPQNKDSSIVGSERSVVPWKKNAQIHQSCKTSVSFGYSMSAIDNFLFVGAPMDKGFGKVFIYQFHPKEGLNLMKDFTFSLVGSPYQKAGYKLRKNIVAAPDFSNSADKKRSTDGTLFLMKNWTSVEQLSVKRICVSTDKEYVMVKYGDIFQYEHPFIYITKKKVGHQRVEIYELNQENTKVELTQILTDGDMNEDLFGHGILVDKNNRVLVISDPFRNDIFIYKKIESKWLLDQTLNMTESYSDLEDLHQCICMDALSSKLVISSPENQTVTIFIHENNKFEAIQTLKSPQVDNYFGVGVSISPDGQWLSVSESSTHKILHIYHWFDSERKFILDEKMFMDRCIGNTLMNPRVLWQQEEKRANLFVCGQGDPNNNGQVMWFSKELVQ